MALKQKIDSVKKPQVLWVTFRQKHLASYEQYFSLENEFSHKLISKSPKEISLQKICKLVQTGGNLFFGKDSSSQLNKVVKHFQELNPKKKYYATWMLQLQALYWLTWSKKVLQKNHPNIIVVWGGLQLYHVALKEAANEKNISILYLENGLLPNTTQIDNQGTNWRSSLRLIVESDYTAISIDQKKMKNLYDSQILPRDQRKSVLNKLHKPSLGINDASLLPIRYAFLPLQVAKDSQIELYSPWIPDMVTLINNVKKGLDAYNQEMTDAKALSLVVKEHPSDFGRVKYDQFKKHWQEQGILFANELPTADLIEKSSVVITINSTVGTESLLKKKPVIVLGSAVYSHPGITEKANSIEEISQALKNYPTTFDKTKVSQFLYYLYYYRLVIGHWKNSNSDHWRNLENRILEIYSNIIASKGV